MTIFPCLAHRPIINPYFPQWGALEIAEDCDTCEVET